jgi:hypothetical protein
MKQTFISMLLVALLSPTCVAQDQPKKEDSAAKPVQQGPTIAYKLDYKVFELDDGKRVNQREFTSLATALEHGGPASTLRIGTRVPVTQVGEKPNYIDVGFNVMTSVGPERGGKLEASIRMELSSFAIPEQNADPRSSSMPVLRNSSFAVWTVLTPGKPQIIASIDDVNSKKRMQVEVTAIRVD